MNPQDIDTQQLNQGFIEIMDRGMEKQASQAGAQYVKMKLRQEGIMRRYFGEVERVTEHDDRYQIDHNNTDTGYMLLEKEPDSYAMRLTAKGQPDGHYIQGNKYQVPFEKFTSPKFEKNEMELRNIRMPITEVIRKNVVLDMQEEEDGKFFNKLNASIEETGQIYTTTEEYFSKNDVTSFLNLIDVNRLRTDCIIMHRSTLNDIFKWNHLDVGDLITKVIENGVERQKFAGKELITSINTDVIKPGEIYGLTSPDYLGAAFDLGDPQFWMQKKEDMFRMSSWYYNGFNIGNTKGVSKMVIAGSMASEIDQPGA